MNHQSFPEHLFNKETRHMMTFAHQDDEINYSGLIGRCGQELNFVWVTNGDGLAPMVGADPQEYAELRKAETDRVLTTLGRSLDRRICLDYSEIEIYDNFVDLTLAPERSDEIMDFFYKIGCRVYEQLRNFRPEVVWTGQFQNGHPEHDLTHILTALALRQLKKEEGLDAAFYQVPEYEYTILIPMRFHPLYKGIVHHIELSAEELTLKEKAFECYPSQVELFEKFRRVINNLGRLGALVGRRFDVWSFLGKEYFSPVPEDIDYSRSTHWFEWANYMFDRNKNIKVRFDKHIARIYKALEHRPFSL